MKHITTPKVAILIEKNSILIWILLVVASCTTKDVRQKVVKDDDTPSVQVQADTLRRSRIRKPHFLPTGNYGIAVTPVLRLMSAPSENSEVVFEVPGPLKVKIVERSPTLVIGKGNSNTTCDEYGYHYFKVEAPSNGRSVSGWIFGNHFYILDTTKLGLGIDSREHIIELEEQAYRLDLAFEDGIGTEGDSSFTDCDQTYLFAVTHIKNKKTVLVQADESIAPQNELIFRDPHGYLRTTQESMGGITTINKISVDSCDAQRSIIVDVLQEYQLGSGTSTICIRQQGDSFVARKLIIRRPWDADANR